MITQYSFAGGVERCSGVNKSLKAKRTSPFYSPTILSPNNECTARFICTFISLYAVIQSHVHYYFKNVVLVKIHVRISDKIRLTLCGMPAR